MPSDSLSLDGKFFPEEPQHPDGPEFFARLTGMLDGQQKESAVVEAAFSGMEELLEKIGSDLYRIASMLLGEGEETVELIEKVVTQLDLTACEDHRAARHQARLVLAAEAIALLHRRSSVALSAPG